MNPVPGFFQGTDKRARVEQVQWLQGHLDLTDEFFARVLGVDVAPIAHWRSGRQELDSAHDKQLEHLWRMFLHLFSLLDFDYGRAKQLLETPSAPEVAAQRLIGLPWAGGSMRNHLEHRGAQGVDEVNRWLTSFRFTEI